jgi:hypothetical protein
MSEDYNHYAAIDYSATGEGRTLYLLITRANPSPDDWEDPPSLKNGWSGTLAVSSETIVKRQMAELVDSYYMAGIQYYTREEFLSSYQFYLPQVVVDMSNPDNDHQPFNLHYFQEFHFNFS